jgi:hypothetical protein
MRASIKVLSLLTFLASCGAPEDPVGADGERNDVLNRLWDCQVTCERSEETFPSSYQACAISSSDALYDDGSTACGADAGVLDGACNQIEDSNGECKGAVKPFKPATGPYAALIDEARTAIIAKTGKDLPLVSLDVEWNRDEQTLNPGWMAFYDASSAEVRPFL